MTIKQAEKYLLLHPRGLKMPAIDKAKYDIVAKELLDILSDGQEWRHQPIFEELRKRLDGKFEGSINYYGEWAKLDLEARGVILRIIKPPLRWKMK